MPQTVTCGASIVADLKLDANAARIRFGPGWTGNSFIENVLTQNTCGTFGTSAGNTFSKNVFTGNTTDAC